MAVKFDLEGMGELIDQLSQTSFNVDKVVDDSLVEAAETMQLEAKRLLKVPTTHHIGKKYFLAPSARNGDKSKIIKNMKISKVVHGYKHGTYIKVYNSDPSAQLTEYGHSGNFAPPHPFLAPAFERKKKEAIETIKNNLIGALSK